MTSQSRTFTTTLACTSSMCAIELPFDPREVFGKLRAPVRVTLNGYSYRSTIAAMGGPPFIPLRRSHREAAGLAGNETLEVTVTLDTEVREVAAPADLVKALEAADAMSEWRALSFTHQREHVEAIEQAKRPETRARRIQHAVAAMRSRGQRPKPEA